MDVSSRAALTRSQVSFLLSHKWNYDVIKYNCGQRSSTNHENDTKSGKVCCSGVQVFSDVLFNILHTSLASYTFTLDTNPLFIDWGCLRTGCWGEYLDLNGWKWQEVGEYCIMMSFIIC